MTGVKQIKLAPDPLVQALMPDPAGQPPDAVVLHGYLGQSTQPGYWRLYLTPVLDCFVEVPEDKIRHSMRLSDNRGTLLWISKDLTLQLHRPQPARIHTGFLDGSIIAGYPAAPVLNPYLAMAMIQPRIFTTYCESALGPGGCPEPGGPPR